MKPQEFINAIAPAARASYKNTRIFPSFTIAEAALESGWGKHTPGMNLFGVKADKSWKGQVTIKQTGEVINGRDLTITDKFRAYSSWQESIEDHAKFLIENPRYANCFTCVDAESFAQAVQKSGYATDPSYAEKIIQIIQQHNLTQFDKE